MTALFVCPITFKTAKAYVKTHHRHHRAPIGYKFCVGVCDAEGELKGVLIAGRPVARKIDDGFTIEFIRVCTDGTRNACSMLLGAAWRVARGLGYHRTVTYTLKQEGGASLRAAGFEVSHETPGKAWNQSEGRSTKAPTYPLGLKVCWHKTAKTNRPAAPPFVQPIGPPLIQQNLFRGDE